MDQRTVTYRMEMPAEQMRDIFGEGDAYIKQIEDQLHVAIIDRDGFVSIIGKDPEAKKAVALLSELTELSAKGVSATQQKIDYGIEMSKENKDHVLSSMEGDVICHTVNGKAVKPMTLGQKQYVEAIRKNMIVFGLGPAGTGKTYLAMALAVMALKNKEVERIILTRPAVEAGEKLGFLPGDLTQKVDPYLRPLYDAMYDFMGADSYTKLIERGVVEVAPLAYMRGRTLSDAFIILDEAQNTTSEQMKMFLTRMGFRSRVVVTGDITQTDLQPGKVSGLSEAVRLLKHIPEIGIVELSPKDIVRHELVQLIVEAYDQSSRSMKTSAGKDTKNGEQTEC